MKGRIDGARFLRYGLCGLGLLLLAGCTADEPAKQQVRIFDGQTETRLQAEEGMTVKEALAEAEISVGSEDQVSPALDTTLQGECEISIRRRARITLVEDENAKELVFHGGQVKDVLLDADITLGKNDTLNHDLEAYLSDGMSVEVAHRFLVSLDVDGAQSECLTEADTVQELLEEQQIHLDAKDQIEPALETFLADGTQIVIQRVFVERVSEFEAVPYETQVEYSSAMLEGESSRRRQGAEGEKEVIYEVTYVDGKEESRRMVEEKIIREPVDTILVKGTAPRRRVVSREQIFDCDGSGHGYYVITWSDGVVEYEDF